ncbi:ABC transporter permease [Spirillospora sp. NPDC050679]
MPVDLQKPSHARRRTGREHWAAFRRSPFVPAVVLLFILAAAAGLFAGSYTYALANPTPRHVPMAVTGDPPRDLYRAMDRELNATLVVQTYPDYARARQALEEQREFAILTSDTLDVASAAGSSVARLLSQAAHRADPSLKVRDIKPLQRTDPQGLAIFYISLAAVIIGFVGAIQLSVHAKALNAGERIAFTAAYAALGALAIVAAVDWLLGVLDLPLPESWFILALTMFTSGMVFTMFNTLFGRWAMIPTWGLMVLLGNPSSGGAVSWPLLPSALGHLGRWLPPGASVNAQHTAIYFGDHQHALPFATLFAWALVSTAVFVIWRHRHPGGRDTTPAHAAA